MWSDREYAPTISRSRPWKKEAVEDRPITAKLAPVNCCQRGTGQRWQMPTISYFLFHVRALDNTVSAPKAILNPKNKR